MCTVCHHFWSMPPDGVGGFLRVRVGSWRGVSVWCFCACNQFRLRKDPSLQRSAILQPQYHITNNACQKKKKSSPSWHCQSPVWLFKVTAALFHQMTWHQGMSCFDWRMCHKWWESIWCWQGSAEHDWGQVVLALILLWFREPAGKVVSTLPGRSPVLFFHTCTVWWMLLSILRMIILWKLRWVWLYFLKIICLQKPVW